MDVKKLYQEIFHKNVEWSNRHEPMMVAGIFLAQALKFYKSALSNDEYEEMLEVISDSSHKVTPFQPLKRTLH
jgi:hypothetical protein